MDRAYWETIATNPRYAPLRERVTQLCDAAPRLWPAITGSDYMAPTWRNDRSAGDRHINENAGLLAALVFRRCLAGFEDASGEPRDEKLVDWLWGFITEPSWAFSAHTRNLPPARGTFHDLGVCTMGASLAEMWETLSPWMETISPRLGEWVLMQIDDNVLTSFGEGVKVGWDEGEVINWLGVCAGGILVMCESLAALGHPRPAARARALAGVRRYLHEAFTRGGECDEGIGYWSYGLEWACAGLSRLERPELEAAVDLDRLRELADYPRRSHLVGDLFYAGNDAPAKCGAMLAFVPWMAGATGSNWLWQWAQRAPTFTGRRYYSNLLREIAALDHGAEMEGTRAKLTPGPASQWLEDQQVVILRAGGGRLVATLGGGHNAERHNHNDLGHFTLLFDGEFIVPDFGAPKPYPADFFGPNRYTYLYASSRGHCCPIINGCEQRTGIEAAGKVVSWDAEAGELVLDLTAAYSPEARLLSWTRTLRRGEEDGAVEIADKFRTEGPTDITQVLWSTPPPVVACEPSEFQIGPLRCVFSPSARAFAQENAEANVQGFHRLEANYATDEGGELQTTIRFYVARPH